MSRPGPAAVLAAGPGALAGLVLDCLVAAGRDGRAGDQEFENALDDALVRRDGPAWRVLAAALWRRPELFAECDRVDGLRTRVRRDACGGVLAGIDALLAQALASGTGLGALALLDGEDVVLPQALFAPLPHGLELNDTGGGPGWEQDADLAELVPQASGGDDIIALPRRWARRRGSGAPPGPRAARPQPATGPQRIRCKPRRHRIGSRPAAQPVRARTGCTARAGR